MDRLFSEIDQLRASVIPPVNILTNGDGLVVAAELPGVGPAGIDLNLERNLLTLRDP